MTVGLVVVSHSAALAAGVAELAGQMAPDVVMHAAGGDDDGSLGTSFEKVEQALAAADTGDGVVVLYDLGSALLTTETAVEMLDPAAASRVLVVDAPLVEAAIEASIAAQNGADLAGVAAAAKKAAGHWSAAGEQAGAGTHAEPTESSERPGAPAVVPASANGGRLEAVAVVRNAQGLHARPASQLVRDLAAWPDAEVQIGRNPSDMVDADSVLMLVALGLTQGEQVQVTAEGTNGKEALDHVVRAFEEGFGEPP